jgi:hypothetical protein
MRHIHTLTAACSALLLSAPAADAMIQVDRGIGGARLGNTKAEVRAALGKPSKDTTGTNEFGTYREYRYRGGLRVLFQGDRRVTGVDTTGLGDRTSRGVGVGSTENAVKTKVGGVTCEGLGGGQRLCRTGDGVTVGGRNTDFFIRDGRVDRVVVAFLID